MYILKENIVTLIKITLFNLLYSFNSKLNITFIYS